MRRIRVENCDFANREVTNLYFVILQLYWLDAERDAPLV
jgi:hypothetical protein